jgi:hypothetical protein
MRTRNRNTIVESSAALQSTVVSLSGPNLCRCGGYYSNVDGSALINNRVISVAGFKSRVGIDESISDVANGHGSYNEVDHTKTVWDFPLRAYSAEGEDSSYGGILAKGTTLGSVSAGPANVQGNTSNGILWDSESNALVRATNTMQLGIQDAGLDMPTFLGELRDFSSLFHSVGRNVKRLGEPSVTSHWEKQVGSFFRKRLKKPIRQTIVDLANADLFNQFAIKPLIADIKAMLAVGKHISSQYDRLLRVEPQYVRSSVSDRDVTLFTETSTDHHWSRWNRKNRVVTAWAKIQFNVSELPSYPAVLADALGFDNLHRTLWELTHWSFLWDYFIQVGDWLKQFQGQFIDLPLTILDQGYSRKFECISDVEVYFDASSTRAPLKNVSANGDTVTGTCTYKRYKRTRQALPFGAIAVPTIQLPNLRQVRNITDLVILLSSRSRR